MSFASILLQAIVSTPTEALISIPVRSFLMFLPIAAIATGLLWTISTSEEDAQRLITDKRQEQIAEIAVISFNVGIHAGISDIRLLARGQVLQELLTDAGPKEKKGILHQYISFLSNKSDYDSIRLLDVNGQELVRVDRYSDGSVRPTPDRDLQLKADRYYFKNALKLPAGSAYVSPLDLNIENEKIEQPIRPTLRFVAPVFDATGKVRGVLVLNTHAQYLFDQLSNEARLRNSEIWLVDENGYWLKGPDPTLEWGFMYPDRKEIGFATSYPDVWKQMNASTARIGTFNSGDGHFTFASTAQLARENANRGSVDKDVDVPNWYVVAHLSQASYLGMINRNGLHSKAFGLAILFALLVISISFGYQWHRRVKHAEQIVDLNKRLDLDNRTLTAVNSELEAFSYSVSHDLRTPLRSIDGFSLALLEDYADQLDNTGRNYLERVRKSAQRMGQLIDDLLALSRVSRSAVEVRDFDMSKICRDVAENLQERATDRHITWMISDNIHGHGDPRLVRILMENLLGNAWKFTALKPAAEIEFGQRTEGGEKIFFVRDTGAGFDMRYADMLFSAFQRLHPEDEFPGTGIGLATAQRIINRHGGRIWAEAEPNKGATFYFTLGRGTS